MSFFSTASSRMREGHDVLKRIREVQEDARIVMLSVDESEETIFRAIDSGAMAYLSKAGPIEKLLPMQYAKRLKDVPFYHQRSLKL